MGYTYHSLLGKTLDLLDRAGRPLLEGNAVHLCPHPISFFFFQSSARYPSHTAHRARARYTPATAREIHNVNSVYFTRPIYDMCISQGSIRRCSRPYMDFTKLSNIRVCAGESCIRARQRRRWQNAGSCPRASCRWQSLRRVPFLSIIDVSRDSKS